MRAAAGIGADQDLAVQVPGQLREREPGRLDMISRGVEAGVPASAQARSRAVARAALIAASAARLVRCQRLDQPGYHRVRCHRPGQGGLPAQYRDIGQAVPAQRQRRGQVRDDLARIVHRPRCPPRLQGG